MKYFQLSMQKIKYASHTKEFLGEKN